MDRENTDLGAGMKKKQRTSRNEMGKEVERLMKQKNLTAEEPVKRHICRKTTEDQ
jgi:hypothetical protein